jgi:hypothetical protein
MAVSASEFEIGDILILMREIGDRAAFVRKYPTLAAKLWSQTVDRTDLFTSHNRIKSGPYAGSRTKRLAKRNRDIVRMSKKSTGGYYDYGYEDIAERFDLSVVTISKICIDAGVRRRDERLKQAA